MMSEIAVVQSIIISLIFVMVFWNMVTVRKMKNEIDRLGLVHIEFGSGHDD